MKNIKCILSVWTLFINVALFPAESKTQHEIVDRMNASGPNAVRSLSWKPDGTELAYAAGRYDCALIANCSTKDQRGVPIKGMLDSAHNGIGDVTQVAWHPKKNQVAIGTEAGAICICDSQSRRILSELTTESTLRYLAGRESKKVGSVLALEWNSEGTRIASGSDDSLARIWKVKKIKEEKEDILGSGYASFPFPLNQTSNFVSQPITATNLLTTNSNVLEHELSHEVGCFSHSCVNTVAWSSSDNSKLASGADDKTVRVWNAKTGECLHVLNGRDMFGGAVYSITWNPKGTILVAGFRNGIVRFWDIEISTKNATEVNLGEAIRAVDWSKDGAWVAAGSDAGNLHLIDAPSRIHEGKIVCKQKKSSDSTWSIKDSELGTVSGEYKGVTISVTPLKLINGFVEVVLALKEFVGWSKPSRINDVKWSNEGKLAVATEYGNVLFIEQPRTSWCTKLMSALCCCCRSRSAKKRNKQA